MERLRDTPQSLGLPEIEKFKGALKAESESYDDESTSLTVREILVDHILRNKYVWILSASYFFVYIVREAVNNWGQIFLIETKGYGIISAASCVAWFEMGGLLGMLTAGWASDRCFSSRRVPFMVLCSAGLAGALFGFYKTQGYFLTDALWIAVVGFLTYGPQMLIGLAVAEAVSKKAASTSNGFAGTFAYLGAAIAGYPLGKITEAFGWYGFFITLGLCSLVTFVILFPLWSVQNMTEPSAAKACQSTECG